MVGTGLAGASAAASLGALGFKVLNFCIQDSPRRAHSIAAQGGINAAKNYQNDGDSVYRLFYDTIKGGDYRAREANIYRLAEVSNAIIDQCVAQGVPFAREYGGLLDNRSFGGAQVSRTFYARGQTGQQLLLGAYSALSREVQRGNVKLYTRYEMLDVVLIKDNEGVERARGIIARNLVTGKIERFAAHAVVIGTGGYGNTYFLSTNAMASNGSAAMQVYRKGAYFANPCFAQIHPTCIPVHGDKQSKLTLMSESLRNDGRIWVPKKLEDAKALQEAVRKVTELEAALDKCRNQEPKIVKDTIDNTKKTLESVITFRQGRTTVDNSQLPNVERIATYLKNHKGASVLIKGYASPEGSVEVNERIARQRAEAVKKMLVGKYGIAEERIVAEGQGVGNMFEEPDWNRVSICTINAGTESSSR